MRLCRWERFKDARTVYNQHGSQSISAVSAATGVVKSKISDLEKDYSLGGGQPRDVGAFDIATLAKYYGVTTDYLLGLTEDPRPNPCAADDLGLSNASIEAIQYFSENSSAALRGLELLLNRLDFWSACVKIEELRKKVAASSADSFEIDTVKQREIENELIAAHPELQDRIQVLYGDLAERKLRDDVISFLENAVDCATGLEERLLRRTGSFKRGNTNGHN